MAIEWKQSLATGVEEIDNQHKELFERINSLIEACNQQKGKEEVVKVMKFLEDYVITHFNSEERLMDQNPYPDINLHKEQHKQFIKSFLSLKDRFETEGVTTLFVINVNRTVVDWLIKHVSDIDKTFGKYLLEKG